VRTEALTTLLIWLSRSSYTESSLKDSDRSNSVDKDVNVRECCSSFRPQNNWKKCVHQLRLPNASYSAGVGHQRFLGEHAKPSNMIRFRKPLEQSC